MLLAGGVGVHHAGDADRGPHQGRGVAVAVERDRDHQHDGDDLGLGERVVEEQREQREHDGVRDDQHAEKSREYAETKLVGAVHPGKGGTKVLGVAVVDNLHDRGTVANPETR